MSFKILTRSFRLTLLASWLNHSKIALGFTDNDKSLKGLVVFILLNINTANILILFHINKKEQYKKM